LGHSPSGAEAPANREKAQSSMSVFNPPYRYEVAEHGPVTIYDSVGVGWIARVKETLPHKTELAAAIVAGLNAAAEAEKRKAQRAALRAAFSVRTRVVWREGDEFWRGVVTAHRPHGGVIIKLDSGGAYEAPLDQLERLP
jgi:hypothetical protein